MKYLAVPQEDVKVDKLAVLLDQVTNSILFEEVVGLLLQVQTTNANILHSVWCKEHNNRSIYKSKQGSRLPTPARKSRLRQSSNSGLLFVPTVETKIGS